jgi:hypothetical protein
MDIPLDEVLHFDVLTHHPSTGAVTDADSTPTFAVYEEATDTDIGVGGNLTKRTSLTGDYRGTFTASAANGFEVGKWYNVIASATVNAIAGKTRALIFRIVLAESVVGEPKVDVGAIGGTAQTATDAKDFFDTGYNPSTHAVALVDATLIANDIASTGLTNIGTTVDARLVAIRLDELLAADSDIDGAQPPTVGSVFHELMSKTAGSFTFDQTTDSLEAIKDSGGGAVTIAAGGITASSFANNSITAAATATDFHTEIQASCNAALAALGLDDIADLTDLPDVVFDANLGSRPTGSFGKAVADELALLDDPRTEPGQGAPPVNPDTVTKIDYLYKSWRNKKTQTATLLSIFADDGTTVDHKSIVSSVGGTTTLGELITGA